MGQGGNANGVVMEAVPLRCLVVPFTVLVNGIAWDMARGIAC